MCVLYRIILRNKTVQTNNVFITIVCQGDSIDSTTTTSSATTVSAGTDSEQEGDRQQVFSTTLIGKMCREVELNELLYQLLCYECNCVCDFLVLAIVIGVIAAIIGALIVIATVGYICYRKYKRRNSEGTSS